LKIGSYANASNFIKIKDYHNRTLQNLRSANTLKLMMSVRLSPQPAKIR